MGLSTVDYVLWLLSAILPILIVVRIIRERLYTPPFDSFVAMLAGVVMRDVLLAILGYDSPNYVFVWECTLPPLLVLQLYAGLQHLRSIARLYPEAGAVAIRLYLICLGLAAAACCFGLPFEFYHFNNQEFILRSLFLVQRFLDCVIAGTLVLVTVFLVRCPAPPNQPPPNLVLHTVLLSLYFGGYGVLFFTENLVALGAVQNLERAQFLLVIVLYLVWATSLSKKWQTGEKWPEVDVILLRKLGS